MAQNNKNGFAFVWILLVVVVLGSSVAGYFLLQSDNSKSTATNTAAVQQAPIPQPEKSPETKQEVAATGTVITTGTSKFGSILFDGNKQAIYIWELEKSPKAECYGDCAEAWPPVLTNGAPVAGGDVKSELLGTTVRTDGTTQVTYNGHPLYYYAHEKPGEVKCHNISTHGGLWWVILPSGVRAD